MSIHEIKDITKNEMKFLLTILKSPEEELNSRNISKKIDISPMGALKIAKRLEKEEILSSKQIGRGKYYKIRLEKDYIKQYIKFILQREAEQSSPYIKRWVNELKKITRAKIVILFGSILTKGDKANDIDVLLITDNKNFNSLKKEIESINLLNTKKIHPIYQNGEDLKGNMKKKDKVILNAIKGIFISGEDEFIGIIKK
jgi:predicted nucleotidyltransferase